MCKKRKWCRALSIVLCCVIALSMTACSKSAKTYNMTLTETKKEQSMIVSNDDNSKFITLPSKSINNLQAFIKDIEVTFPYSKLFNTEECFKRLQTTVSVSKHDSIFDSFTTFTLSSLLDKVKQNNATYIEVNTFGYEQPKDDFLIEISKLIIDTISKLKEQQPDIDYNRVLCNLSNLKILYKKGMVDNAQVTADMVMNISPNMFEIVDLMSGENGCRDVVVHEIMHIVQMGCKCEGIEHCTRRCGFSYRWDDFELNTTDFGWLFEGSAERMMCNITGDVALTYKYMINYICTANLATTLKNDVPANCLETLSFYSDIDKVYELFGCCTKEDKIEILNMLIATNIIQMAPDEFLDAYELTYKEDVGDPNTIDKINYTLKPSVCVVLTKVFYNQLLDIISNNTPITVNDLLFIINLFEASLDNHLKYSNLNYQSYNEAFIKTYLSIRKNFFDALSSNNDIDISEQYKSYSMLADKNTINASLKWLTKDKTDFLIERLEYLEFNRNSKIG